MNNRPACFLATGLLRRFAIPAIACLAVPAVQAQLIYVSDNRSVSAAVGLQTNGYGSGQVTYSGDYSASAGSSPAFANFNTNLSGSAWLQVVQGASTNAYYASVGVQQTSFLNSQEISYSSFVNESGNTTPGHCNESSYLQVLFIVSSPVTYNLTCQRGPDPLFSAESWTLSSASQGVLAASSHYNGGNYTGPFAYTGILSPGDEYTFTLQETASSAPAPYGDAGGLQAILTVPEPAPGWLLGLGFCGLLAFKVKRRNQSA